MTRHLAVLGCALTLGVMGCSEPSVFACTEQGIREAIAEGGGPHTFECDGPITVVTEATIEIDNDVVLDGEGNLTVDAFSQHRVFLVAQNATAELRGVTVSRGTAEFGGGIFNEGTLTLTNSTVSGNSGGWFGGGISNEGTLTLTDSTVSDNSGGGIHSSGTLVLTNSTVSGNTANEGGGIDAYIGGWSTLIRSTVSGNSAESGGGIVSRGTVALIDSTVSGNSADYHGGGIYVTNFGSPTLTNSTVSGNTAVQGGGIFHHSGILTLANSTLSGNAADAGGAIYVREQSTIWNSLIVGDCGIDGEAPSTSLGHNIESPGDTCGFDQPTDQVGVGAEQLSLGPLADNGGPTMTHALLLGSLAIDVIPEGECLDADGEPLTTDQRGEPRPAGDACDVGAFEVQP